MLQTYGGDIKCCSLSCKGGMMIEYMSTVILTGCGPEVCATSKTTKQRLRQQAEEDGGALKDREGLYFSILQQSGEIKQDTQRERETEGCVWRELVCKNFKLPSNTAWWSGLRNYPGNNTITRWVGYACVQALFSHSLWSSAHTQLLLRITQLPHECTHLPYSEKINTSAFLSSFFP